MDVCTYMLVNFASAIAALTWSQFKYVCRYYGNTTANLERLLNLMSNEVVMASKRFLPNEFLLDPEEVGTCYICTYVRTHVDGVFVY